jgi:hypothetical protein
MGAWGHRALESDEGLDVVDFLKEYITAKNGGDVRLTLGEIIAAMRDDGFFGRDFDEIDFYYDHSAMALTELYLGFLDSGKLDYDHEEDEQKSLRKRVKDFTADSASLDFLLRFLTDIRDEKPDADGEREIVDLWRESKSWEMWQANLNMLIKRLESLTSHSKIPQRMGDFINWAQKNGWKITLKNSKIENLPKDIAERYNIPDEYKTFLENMDICTNADESVWFLCIEDYLPKSEDGFRWNEFETISLGAADSDSESIKNIKNYWDKHFPIIMSVKGDYEYYAINTENKKNKYFNKFTELL